LIRTSGLPEPAAWPSLGLTGTDLSRALLRGSDLREPNVSGVNPIEARWIANETLEQEASSLEGVTMPNGQKYEDWLNASSSMEFSGVSTILS
jgi:uncharacterized protein YjbI with pentapeptide repeats